MNSQNKRVFLGFSLTEQQAQMVSLIQSQLPDNVRLIPKANLHMTLAFLGGISPHQLTMLSQQITILKKPTFEVTLNELAYWKKPKICCLKGMTNDANLIQLANNTQLIAKNLNLHQSEYPYTPHMTLCRKAKLAMETLIQNITYQPLILRPNKLHLFESYSGEHGVEYPILKSWSLANRYPLDD
ncbi:RNA 2',3'-cyclic phosphodiesterase [Shewanella surugensis]|uniref:RNA 2',3'-cyclic phosphodiesterase n=1 Tax=Shewanella surugensis TaxID=212020 RepID=A0ABT0LDN1_9GAMM|nr:RNA 2',3'-cyclic phosphodiesterase [Shewanella surugensis]MCL1125807.1 RNA 2',3'-cyclic phosphodiesterase [Shewanella surugensis]